MHALPVDIPRHIRRTIRLGGETEYLCGTRSHMADDLGRASLPPVFPDEPLPPDTCPVCLAVLRTAK